jgi:hypothetical protein
MITINIRSPTNIRRQRRGRLCLPLFGFVVSLFCCIQIDLVKCLDTIVNDHEYSDGGNTPYESLMKPVDDDIARKIMPEDMLTSSKSQEGTSLEDILIDNGSSTNSNQHLDRLWGSSGTGSSTVPLKIEASDDGRLSDNEKHAEGKQHQGRWGSTQQANVPLKGKISDASTSSHINPPEGFAITARVYIDDDDKLAHFDVTEETNGEVNSTMKSNSIVLPYYDCGISGATTAALPVKQIYFRHALSSPTTVYVDQSSTDSKLVLYPVLAIALSSLTVELDSGVHMDFVAGDAILFEDTIRPGHLLTVSKESKNLTVLLITLPNKHHHIGKQYLSLKAALKAYPQKSMPCSIPSSSNDADKVRWNYKADYPEYETMSMTNSSFSTSSTLLTSPEVIINSSPAVFSDAGRRIRMVFLGTIAFSLSTLMADFLGRTAPLWLAVGVGGTCFVLGSTYALTLFSDFLYTTLSLWHERRKLEKKINYPNSD